ncbi:hypothetical protein F4821DRAFT_233916 [Hypoxylon rubiginosum]|uniref:Uncharacterized protein n=1 Tax=Hypoxylon rubiginosum TaxID=110542 RepID=A0ACC0D6W7_9PEZI|nr:hypothetical protein F4821DRAFT_233916 [Hypoxylon rubiginosum]
MHFFSACLLANLAHARQPVFPVSLTIPTSTGDADVIRSLHRSSPSPWQALGLVDVGPNCNRTRLRGALKD